METIEESLKNRIFFIWNKKQLLASPDPVRKKIFEHRVEEIYPLKLNIKNSVDLIARLTPSIYSRLSYLRKNNTSEQNYPYSSNTKVSIKAFCLTDPQERERQDLFEIKFKFSDITKVNVFRSIKQKIENEVIWYIILRSRNDISRERREQRERERREKENRRKEKERAQINKSQLFKSDECVICLTNPPNVLFCNCGHLCLCVECNKIKDLYTCPFCKFENTIKRMIE